MRYVDHTALQCTLGVMGQDNFYCNGTFDPYVALGGHQPMGYDQMMQYYNYCIVIGSKITVDFMPSGSLNNQAVPVMVGVWMGSPTETVNYTDWTAYREAGYPVHTLALINSRTRIKSYFSHKKQFGQTPFELSQTANTTSSNALRLAQWKIWLQSSDKTSTSIVYQVNIRIDYIAIFTNKENLPQS